ncbi:MAG: hypothetical protein AAGK04_11540, partial [Planctomycetota bacterium]
PDGHTFCLPAYLSRIQKKMAPLDPAGARESFDWVSPAQIKRLIEWDRVRCDDHHTKAELLREGACRLAHFIDTAFHTLRPAVVMTTNKIEHINALTRLKGLSEGRVVRFVERSPIDGVWVEPDGMFRESRIWQEWPAASLADDAEQSAWRAAGARLAASLAEDPYGFRREEADTTDPLPELADKPRPWVFLPMDNVLWTAWEQRNHPQGQLDQPIWPTPEQGIAAIAREVRELGGTLIVKPHPSCRAIDATRLAYDTVLATGDLHQLVQAADVVACFNTKVAFPALASNKPVVTMAPNPIAASGVTEHATEARDLPRALRRALHAARSGGLTNAQRMRFETFIGWLDQEVYYRSESTPTDASTRGEQRGPREFVEDLIAEAELRLELTTSHPPTLDAALDNLQHLVEGRNKGRYTTLTRTQPKPQRASQPNAQLAAPPTPASITPPAPPPAPADWAAPVLRWLGTRSGAVVLSWAALVAFAVVAPVLAVAYSGLISWWIAIPIAAAAIAAASLLALFVPYMLLRVQSDVLRESGR